MTIVRRATVMLTFAAALVAVTPSRSAAQATSTPTRVGAQPAPAPASGHSPAAALQVWVEAFNSRDPKRIVALYAPTAVFWGTTAPTIATTPEQIWNYFKDAGQRPLTRVTIDSTHLRTFADVAVASGAYTFADVKDGVTGNVRPARYTIVLQKIGVAWLIVDHHSSRVPQP